jgi:isochorismate hydrolase
MGALYSFVAQLKQYELDETNRQITKNLEDWNKNLTDWLLFIEQMNSEELEEWQERCNNYHTRAAMINNEITRLRENIRNVI